MVKSTDVHIFSGGFSLTAFSFSFLPISHSKNYLYIPIIIVRVCAKKNQPLSRGYKVISIKVPFWAFGAQMSPVHGTCV